MNGLQIVDLKEPKLLARLLHLPVEENAYLELQNYLASVPILELPYDTVSNLLADYDISLEVAKPYLRNLYRRILRHFAQTGVLSAEALEQLEHLQRLFGLTELEAQQIQHAVIYHIYETEVRATVASGYLTEAQKNRLKRLMKQLRIPPDVGQSIYRKQAEFVLERAIDDVIFERRLSPEKDRELQARADNLGVPLNFNWAVTTALAQCRTLWRIEQGEVPEVEVPIALKPGERCATYVPASYYKAGKKERALFISDTKMMLTLNVMQWLAQGTLYITNQRLIFSGGGRTASISFTKMLGFKFRGPDLKIKKESGRDRMFRIERNRDLVEAILHAQTAGLKI